MQESGRAGRDGRAAASIVYYNTQERERMSERLKRAAQDAPNRGIKKAASQANLQAQLESFSKVVRYCETTHRCRHEMIVELFGDYELERLRANQGNSGNGIVKSEEGSSPCDYACDICKEGPKTVAARKSRMVAESVPEDFVDPGMAPIMQLMFPRAFH